MLSGLKSYLFGGNDVSVIHSAAAAATVTASAVTEVEGMRPIGEEEDKEDWVLVDTNDVINNDLTDGLEYNEALAVAALEESWIVTQESTVISSGSNGGGSKSGRYGRRQPKGTKPRRWRGGRKHSTTSNGKRPIQSSLNLASSLDDAESNSSSIAIVASPEPVTRPVVTPGVSASTVLAASSDAKQMAAITAARSAKQYVDKKWMSRNNLSRANATMMAASGRNNRRCHLMTSRLCGSNNNRKSHQY